MWTIRYAEVHIVGIVWKMLFCHSEIKWYCRFLMLLIGGLVVECSTRMRKVVSSNPLPDMEALGKASLSPAHGRGRMAALCQGTRQLSFT